MAKSKEVVENTTPPIILDDDKYLQSVVSKAYRLAETQIENGTASSQVITQFLKMGDPKTRAENEKLRKEVELLNEKIATLQQSRRNESAYDNLIETLKSYGASND